MPDHNSPFEPASIEPAPARNQPAVSGESANEGAYRKAGWRFSVLGDVRVDGVSGLDDNLKVGAALGSALIDLTSVEIGDLGVDVRLGVVGGGATVVVPDGTTVVDSATVLLGSTNEKLAPASPTAGEVRLTGVVALGDLKVYSASTRPPSIGDRLRKRFGKDK